MEGTQEQRNLKRLEDSLRSLDHSDLTPIQKQEMMNLLYNLFIGCNVSFESFQETMEWLHNYHRKWETEYIKGMN